MMPFGVWAVTPCLNKKWLWIVLKYQIKTSVSDLQRDHVEKGGEEAELEQGYSDIHSSSA